MRSRRGSWRAVEGRSEDRSARRGQAVGEEEVDHVRTVPAKRAADARHGSQGAARAIGRAAGRAEVAQQRRRTFVWKIDDGEHSPTTIRKKSATVAWAAATSAQARLGFPLSLALEAELWNPLGSSMSRSTIRELRPRVTAAATAAEARAAPRPIAVVA